MDFGGETSFPAASILSLQRTTWSSANNNILQLFGDSNDLDMQQLTALTEVFQTCAQTNKRLARVHFLHQRKVLLPPESMQIEQNSKSLATDIFVPWEHTNASTSQRFWGSDYFAEYEAAGHEVFCDADRFQSRFITADLLDESPDNEMMKTAGTWDG